MKKAIPWMLMGILGILILLLLSDRSSLKNDLKKIEKDSKEQKAIQENTIALLYKGLAEKDEKIDEINGALDSANTVIAGLEVKVVDSQAAVIEARKGWAAFSIECQAKLEEVDSAWAASFSLSQQEAVKLKEQMKLADERDLFRQGEILDLKKVIEAKDRIIAGCEAAQKDIVRACLKQKQRGRLETLAGGVVGFVLGKL